MICVRQQKCNNVKYICLGNGQKHGKDCFRQCAWDEQEVVHSL